MNAQTKAANHLFVTESACDHFTWDLNGETYTSDTVVIHLSGDTLYVLDLVIHQHGTYTVSKTAGCFYNWADSTYAESGTYTATFKDHFECDSVVTLNLTIADTSRETLDTVVCKKYVWRGKTFTADTTCYDTVQADPSANVCPAVYTLNLQVNKYGVGADVDTSVCKQFAWNSHTYTADTAFRDTVMNAATICDSIYDVSIHIIVPSAGTITDTTVTGCNKVSFGNGSNKITATESLDTNRITTVTTNGQCINNTLNIHLVVNKSKYFTKDTTSCGPFTWGNYTSDETTIDTLKVGTTSLGCDSLMVLNLTVREDLAVSIRGNLDIRPGESTTLFAEYEKPATLLWNYLGTTSSDTSVTLTNLQQNTDVTLTATAPSGCSRTTSVTIMVSDFVSISDVAESNVSIFPNPASSLLTISCAMPMTQITVFNAAGQQVEAIENAGEQKTLDIARYNNGELSE